MKTDVDKSEILFCENIKALRQKEQLSKTEMAGKLNISIRSLSMLEKGIIPPRLNPSVVIALLENFNICADDFLDSTKKSRFD